MRNRMLTVSIVAILLAFLSVPIGGILYGGGAGAIGGLAIIATLIILQLPMFLLLKRMGWIPKIDRDDSSETQ